jgi:SPOR domain
MADDSNFRSYRPADQRLPAQSAAPAGGRQGSNDPLAELARLIGQTDPFAELNKTAPPRGNAAAQTRPAPGAKPTAQQPGPAVPQDPTDPYGSPLQFSGKGFDSRSYTEPQQESFQPAYDPAIFGTPQEADSGFPSEAYYGDPSRLPQGGDEAYEDDYAEERPRRGPKLVLAAVTLVVIGASGVFGYLALFGGGPSGPPPVIKANTAPSKVAPTPSAEASNKQIYDRVGDASQGERVVSREEKPVEVKDTSRPVPARVVFPGMPATTASTPDTAMAAYPPLPTDPGGPSAAEPKKIRTLTIRPDQPSGTGSTARPNSAPTPAPAQRTAAAPPAAPPPAAAPSAAPPAQHDNAPLSLNPQVANAEASARPAFPPPPRTAAPAPAASTRLAAVPPATDVAAGAYTVQVSSQRSENEAQASFRNLQAKFPNLLGDRQPIIRRADLGEKGIYFRAMVGGFASADQATQFCSSLKSAGGQCVVARN